MTTPDKAKAREVAAALRTWLTPGPIYFGEGIKMKQAIREALPFVEAFASEAPPPDVKESPDGEQEAQHDHRTE